MGSGATLNKTESSTLDRRARSRRLLGAVLGISFVVAAWLYVPAVQEGPILCPLRATTGLSCPGCGMTRSFCSMTQGHFADAFQFNLFGPVLFVLCIVFPPRWIAEAWTSRPLPSLSGIWFNRRAAAVCAVLLGTWHVSRMVYWGVTGSLGAEIAASPMGRVAAWAWELVT